MTDPRSERNDAADAERGIMPVVARSRGGGVPGWVLGVGAGGLALLLFGVLDAHRRALEAPPAAMRTIDAVNLPPPPPALEVPPEPVTYEPPPPTVTPPLPVSRPLPVAAPVPAATARAQGYQPQVVSVAPTPTPVTSGQSTPARPNSQGGGGATLVVDNSVARPAADGQSAARSAAAPGGVGSTDRARASMFANRATTVPQGTLIPAVLETAFNSTRPGFARALVSRDVAGFDGTRVLIPRGSRLIGEYQSETAPGQKRALVIWSRLIRPDGAVIQIASPAADTVGRGGVKASVNTHFLERFSGAILQSALDVGVNLASSRLASGTVVVLPNTLSAGTSQVIRPNVIPPTLSVKAGVSISVFVARDLDFTDVETSP